LALIAATAQDPTLYGINTGIVALALNAVVATLVSLATSPPGADAIDRFRDAAFSEVSSK
jgi:hypothetical protein